jgi:hypothetical protein
MKTKFDHLLSLTWASAGFYLMAAPEYSKAVLFLIGVLCIAQAVGVLLTLWGNEVEDKLESEDEQLWKIYNDKEND